MSDQYKTAAASLNEAITAERERCAGLLEMSSQQLRLLAGELSSQELRTVQAVLKNRALLIRQGAVEAMDRNHTPPRQNGVSADSAAELEAEVMAWRERFPEHAYRKQDDCVALKLGN